MRWAVIAAGSLIGLTAESTALAQTFDDPTGPSWRRRSGNTYESPQSWALELRFGPYEPNIDDEFGGTGPYDHVFGDSTRWYLGLELDWQALRIPHFGSIGPGFSWGYTRMNANARLTGSNEMSSEETSLWIMPMYVVGVLRVDVLANDIGVPLVPYLKAGVGYALWKTSDGLGTSAYETAEGETDVGRGSSYGWHFAPGIALQLDVFDEHAANNLDNSVGVNHSYAYVEWMRSKLDGFGSDDQMHVGTSTWVAGLAFEF